MENEDIEVVEKFLSGIDRLKVGNKLLESLWREIGPYRERYIPDDLWFKVQDFFGFDDSE